MEMDVFDDTLAYLLMLTLAPIYMGRSKISRVDAAQELCACHSISLPSRQDF